MATIGKTRKKGDAKHKWKAINNLMDKCIKCPVERVIVRDGYEYLFVPGTYECDTICYAPPCNVIKS